MNKHLRCRFPDKRRYPTKSAAEHGLTSLWGSYGARRFEAYQCGDHWHYGTRHEFTITQPEEVMA